MVGQKLCQVEVYVSVVAIGPVRQLHNFPLLSIYHHLNPYLLLCSRLINGSFQFAYLFPLLSTVSLPLVWRTENYSNFSNTLLILLRFKNISSDLRIQRAVAINSCHFQSLAPPMFTMIHSWCFNGCPFYLPWESKFLFAQSHLLPASIMGIYVFSITNLSSWSSIHWYIWLVSLFSLIWANAISCATITAAISSA